MKSVGYDNIQRGEKGSKDEHLHHTKFKVMKEKEHLEKLSKDIKSKKTSIKNIDTISVKNALLDNNKIVVDKAEFADIRTLAKKQIVAESKDKKLLSDNKKMFAEIKELKQENQSKKTELYQYKSVKNKLSIGKTESENSNLKSMLDKVIKFIELMNLKEELNKFLIQNNNKER